MQRTPALTLLGSAIAVLLAACTTSTPAPVVDRTARPVAGAPTPPRPAAVSAPAPVQPGMTVGSQFYVVQKGDTLYGVARANNLDPNTLATWNSLPPGSGLRDGQVLRLTPPLGSAPAVTAPGTTVTAAPTAGAIQGQPLPAAASTAPAPAAGAAPPLTVTPVEAPLKRDPKAQRAPYSDAALAAMQRGEGTTPSAVVPNGTPSPATPASAPAPVATGGPTPAPGVPTAAAPANAPAVAAPTVDLDVKTGGGAERDGITWSWPVTGRVTSKFNDKAPMKGIDIVASASAPVLAAATGKVIYVGKEPRGYGQMIVVSHAKETVSVYFHADKVQVKEQQRVLLGQKLAEVASGGDNKMHFEVRRQGRPIDPVTLMPK